MNISCTGVRKTTCGAGLHPARRLHRRSLGIVRSRKGPIENRLQDEILPHMEAHSQ
jgi:hypothetical protein